jgi:hypothetical protein
MKIGFVEYEQKDGGVRYDRKSMLGRAIGGIFKEYVIVYYDNETISVNSKRNILTRIQMHLSRMG